MKRLAAAVVLLASAGVVGGASNPPTGNIIVAQPPQSFQNEKARKCEKPPMQFSSVGAGTVQSVYWVTTSDGWCSGTSWMKGNRPWDSATLVDAPEHGEVFVANSSRGSVVGYRAARGYVGTDQFEIRWQPTGAMWIYHVTVEH